MWGNHYSTQLLHVMLHEKSQKVKSIQWVPLLHHFLRKFPETDFGLALPVEDCWKCENKLDGKQSHWQPTLKTIYQYMQLKSYWTVPGLWPRNQRVCLCDKRQYGRMRRRKTKQSESLVANMKMMKNDHTTLAPWTGGVESVGNLPECKVRIAVYGYGDSMMEVSVRPGAMWLTKTLCGCGSHPVY